jgi:hypothetical protein
MLSSPSVSPVYIHFEVTALLTTFINDSGSEGLSPKPELNPVKPPQRTRGPSAKHTVNNTNCMYSNLQQSATMPAYLSASPLNCLLSCLEEFTKFMNELVLLRNAHAVVENEAGSSASTVHQRSSCFVFRAWILRMRNWWPTPRNNTLHTSDSSR